MCCAQIVCRTYKLCSVWSNDLDIQSSFEMCTITSNGACAVLILPYAQVMNALHFHFAARTSSRKHRAMLTKL